MDKVKGMGKEDGKGEREKGRTEKSRTLACTDTRVILYSVQCYA